MPLVVFEEVGRPRVGEFWTLSEVKNILKNETIPNEKSEMEEGMMRAECEVFN